MANCYFEFECSYCGRKYRALGSRAACVGKAHRTHETCCKNRTPAERRAVNARAEKAWARKPPITQIKNNAHHWGLKG